jgi:transcription-repair coupling factor (superfamily II helicase)
MLTRVPGGYDAMVLADLARQAAPRLIVHVARDDQRLATLAEAIGFFAPDIRILRFPAWDCLPYDRIGPMADIVAQRLSTLSELARGEGQERPAIVLATVNAVVQRVPPRPIIAQAHLRAAPGNVISTDKIMSFLSTHGFSRSGTVVDPGDFAVRGGIIDLFPPGVDEPIRLDFFGDMLESIRSFDPQSQRTTGKRGHSQQSKHCALPHAICGGIRRGGP